MDKSLGPYMKLERAQVHIDELRSEIENFLQSDPYRISIELDPESGMVGPYVEVRRLIPNHWSTIIGDAVHNMRASFDLTLNAIVEDKFFGSAKASILKLPDERYRSGIPPIKGLSEDHFKKLVSLQPYNTGKSDLRIIHDLDIRDKHQMLVVAANASVLLNLQAKAYGGTISIGSISKRTTELGRHHMGVGINVAGMPIFDPDVQISTKITIVEPPSVSEFEVTGLLDRLLAESWGFVSEFVARP